MSTDEETGTITRNGSVEGGEEKTIEMEKAVSPLSVSPTQLASQYLTLTNIETFSYLYHS